MNWKKMIGVMVLALSLILANGYNCYAGESINDLLLDARLITLNLDNKADQVEVTGSNVKYTFDDWNATIFAFVENDVLKLVCNEKNICNIIEINQQGQLYLDGTYVTTMTENVPQNNNARMLTGWQYRETPSYGKANEYTVYYTTTSCRDIKLQQNLADISIAALAVVLTSYYPAAASITSLATTIKTAFVDSYTTSLSCKTVIKYHKDSASGWKNGMYCEKHSVTWYENKDFSGRKTYSTHYESRTMV